MKQLPDLEIFTKNLMDKGYTGYFQTEAAYSGKLKESISKYLDACGNGSERPNSSGIFLLSTYLRWLGDDKPSIECNMWVRHKDGVFDLQKMEIKSKDRYGQLLKKSELKNLSTSSVPIIREAIEKVSEFPQQKLSSRRRGFKM